MAQEAWLLALNSPFPTIRVAEQLRSWAGTRVHTSYPHYRPGPNLTSVLATRVT